MGLSAKRDETIGSLTVLMKLEKSGREFQLSRGAYGNTVRESSAEILF